MADDTSKRAGESEVEDGSIPLKLGRVYAAELLFHLGEEEAALEILHDAEKSSDVVVPDEARLIRKRLLQNRTPTAPAEGPSN